MAAYVSASFAPKNVLPQNFPFKQTLMNYVLKNANSKLFKKLNKTCKYFFANFNYNIIDYFRFLDYKPWNGAFNGYKFRPNNLKMLNILSKNVWLTDKLIIDYWIDKFCDVLIPKIVRFDIKELTINKCPNFPYKYFQILTKSKTLKSLKLYETQIFSSSDMNEMAFDEILASVENVNFISINPCNLLSKNIPGFKLINRKNKLKQIELFQIAQNPLISEIQEFFKNNVENGYLNKTDIIIEFQDISTSYLFKDSLPKKATPN